VVVVSQRQGPVQLAGQPPPPLLPRHQGAGREGAWPGEEESTREEIGWAVFLHGVRSLSARARQKAAGKVFKLDLKCFYCCFCLF